MYKNIEKQKVLHMAEQVDYQDGQIISRTLVQNSKLSMTLFAFEKDEEISTHAAGGDAMVTVLMHTSMLMPEISPVKSSSSIRTV